MKVIKNCLWVVKQVFRCAPGLSVFVVFFEVSVALFRPFQIIITQRIIDYANSYIQSGTQLTELIIWGVMLVTILILWVTFQQAEGYLIKVPLKKKLVTRYAPQVLNKLESIPYSFFEDEGSNDTLERVAKDPVQLLLTCFYRINISFFSMFSVAATVALIFTYSIWLGLGVIALTIPMSFLINKSGLIEYSAWEDNTIYRRREKDLRQLVADKHAVYEMSVFDSGDYVQNKWYSYQTQLYKTIKSAMIKKFGTDMLYEMLYVVYTVFAGGLTIASFLKGSFTIGQLAAIFDSMHTISTKLARSSRSIEDVITYSSRCELLKSFMSIRDKAKSHEKTNGFDIVFSHVYFTYPNTDREILHDVNIRIKQGERIAFVGENGSGKSTIIKLLCGLYPVTHGKIFIGGCDVSTMSEKSRYEFISVLFQDFQPYNITIRENTAIGSIDKMHDDKALIKALKDADFYKKLAECPNGLDTMLGKLTEDGVDLSRGQWQRLAMSRAFVSQAAFVALDEPTSALDPIAESRMYESFAKIFKDRGTIMVSHRLASAKMADRIFVIDGGRIVEEGNHDKLMEYGGLYKQMFERQASWYEEGEDK